VTEFGEQPEWLRGEGLAPAPRSPLGQSVQTVRQGGPERGPDPSKQVRGRGATRDYRYFRTFARSGGRSCKRHRRTMPSRPASTAAGEGPSTESDLRRQRLRRNSRQSSVAMLPLGAQYRRARGPTKRIRSTPEAIGHESDRPMNERLVGLAPIAG
jgi:hypothetical protein